MILNPTVANTKPNKQLNNTAINPGNFTNNRIEYKLSADISNIAVLLYIFQLPVLLILLSMKYFSTEAFND